MTQSTTQPQHRPLPWLSIIACLLVLLLRPWVSLKGLANRLEILKNRSNVHLWAVEYCQLPQTPVESGAKKEDWKKETPPAHEKWGHS